VDKFHGNKSDEEIAMAAAQALREWSDCVRRDEAALVLHQPQVHPYTEHKEQPLPPEQQHLQPPPPVKGDVIELNSIYPYLLFMNCD
jgi:hypothetical protein